MLKGKTRFQRKRRRNVQKIQGFGGCTKHWLKAPENSGAFAGLTPPVFSTSLSLLVWVLKLEMVVGFQKKTAVKKFILQETNRSPLKLAGSRWFSSSIGRISSWAVVFLQERDHWSRPRRWQVRLWQVRGTWNRVQVSGENSDDLKSLYRYYATQLSKDDLTKDFELSPSNRPE